MAQRYMDDIVDLELEKIDKILKKIESDPESEDVKRVEKELWLKIKYKAINGRRTGLGITAEGDMIAALGLTYGTKEATEFSKNIHKILAIEAYKSSCVMAKERGSFPIYDYNKEVNNPFINRLIQEDNELNNLLKTCGRRNIALLTCAPTGTTSLMTQTTSGIEPAFKVVYKRRRKINPSDKNVKVSFVDEVGDSWEEYIVFHHKFIVWLEVNNYNIEDVKKLPYDEIQKIVVKSPYYNATANDINWLEKVRLQGEIQKFVDHSISVTVNLPEDVSEDVVSKVYEEGWKTGCKGITVYREGSKSGVLVSADKKQDKSIIKENNAPKRPKVLEADYYVAKANGQEFAVVIGLLEGKPYEVFAFENPPMNKNTKGKTIKVEKGHYKFVNGEFEIENLQLAAERKEERTLTLAASMLLRHGAPIKHVNNVIKKIDDNITSFSSVVRRYLSRYITEEETGEACPDCGSKLIMQEGCVKCSNCGHSKCG